ncbi:MAG: hypothetical protein NWQ06_08265 [Leeuwenhoekiella sp.]|nr:hypothetical protein [Leeuwenhoekiella sp.]
MTLLTDENISSYHRSRYSDLLDHDHIGYHTIMRSNTLMCTDCPLEEFTETNDWEYSESTTDSTSTDGIYEYKAKVTPKKDGVMVKQTGIKDSVYTKQDSIN